MQPNDPHSCNRKNNIPTSCWLCDGGLGVCKICGLAERELDQQLECLGVKQDDTETPQNPEYRFKHLSEEPIG